MEMLSIIISLPMITFSLNEILSKIDILKFKIICLKIREILSIFLSLLLCFLYHYTEKTYIVNNIMAILILICLNKLIKITSFKHSLSYLLISWFFDLFSVLFPYNLFNSPF